MKKDKILKNATQVRKLVKKLKFSRYASPLKIGKVYVKSEVTDITDKPYECAIEELMYVRNINARHGKPFWLRNYTTFNFPIKESDLLKGIRRDFHKLLTHEFDEQARFDGDRIWDPHEAERLRKLKRRMQRNPTR